MRSEPDELTAADWREQAFREMSERTWGLRVEQTARLNGWTYYHTFKSQHSVPGFPDYVFVRGSDLFFAELKTETGKLTDAQRTWRDYIEGAGREWHCWRPNMIDDIEARFARPEEPAISRHECDALCQCEPRKKTKHETGLSNHPGKRKHRDGVDAGVGQRTRNPRRRPAR